MKALRLSLVVVLVLAACSSLRTLRISEGPEIYTEFYFRITDAAPVPKIEFQFEDLKWMSTEKDRFIGLCDDAGPDLVITLDPEYWAEASAAQREILVLHELGHCVGGLEHVETIGEDNCPVSLMFPKVISSACYRKHKFEYWRSLQ